MKFVAFPEVHVKVEGMDNIRIPRMMKVRQIYDNKRIENLETWIEEQLNALPGEIQNRLDQKRICITAGSRGIPHLDLIIKTTADWLKKKGAKPFVIPAMGSHGGGTAEGQKELLAGFGITEEAMGIPIVSSMEVVQVDSLYDGTPVYCDKNAYESDGIIILNKVKPHTDFRGDYESGLAKMCAIGIAKHEGASYFHMMGFPSFAERIPAVAKLLIEKAPVVFGMGIVQNAYDEISELEVMPADQILSRDAALLRIAKEKIANFKLKNIDVLIIDEIGKEISGNGHDPNVTGRSNSPGFEKILNCKKLLIRGITEKSHHNGCGLSAADVTTRKVMNDIDLETTWTNVITSTMLNGGKLPIYTNDDESAIRLCIRTCNGIDFDKVKVVRIKNTLEMETIQMSEAYLEDVRARSDMEIVSEPYEMSFDKNGNIID